MKKYIIACLTVLLVVFSGKADNLSVNSVMITPGQTTIVDINLNNTSYNLVSFQMDLTLPNGISLNRSGCTLSDRITDADQELVIGKQGEHVYRLTSTSFNLTPIAGTKGKLITLSITAANTFAGGQATISNIVFANKNSETINLDDTSFNINSTTFGGGNGTEFNPYILLNANDFFILAEEVKNGTSYKDLYFKVGVTSIDFDGIAYTPIGNESNLLFEGNFDGNNVVIKNLSSTHGLFGYTGTNSNIRNIVIDESCTISGHLDVGGIVGANKGSITNCINRAAINSTGYRVGGICGDNMGTISNCTNYGSVKSTNESSGMCGGIAGDIDGGGIFNCVNYGSVNAIASEVGGIAGLLCGFKENTIENCINKANVIGRYEVGGINGTSSRSHSICNNIVTECTITSTSSSGAGVISKWGGSSHSNNYYSQDVVLKVGKSTYSGMTPRGVWTSDGPNDITENNGAVLLVNGNSNITFADPVVKSLCLANWDKNNDGELSKFEAAVVTDLGEAFKENTTITSFNELSYFTGLTSIGDRTFYKCSSLTNISIPSSVTTIGDYAFYYCLGLTTLPALNNVTTIGDNAFDCCGGLVSIFIPVSVKSFGRNVFGDCHNITSIEVENGNPKFDSRNNCNAIIETGTNTLVIGCQNTIIPTDVTAIGQNAFRTCLGLTSITIPVSVTSIGNEAFYYCNNLTSINIPKNVNDIVGTPFGFCISMATITVDAENTKYDSRDNCNAIIETETNTLIAGCKTTEIPNSVTAIGAIAFWGSQELTSIIIPNSVTSIGEWSFFATPNLTSVTVGNPSPVAIAENTFSNRANATLCVPAGAKAAYQAAAYWNEFKEIVELDEDAKADNKMLVEDATIVIGSEGKLSVRLTNNQQILGFSADVHLPNGVTPKTDGSGNMIITTASRVPVTVMGNVTSDGVAHFAILTNGTPIAGNDGEIFSFEIQADDAMTAGNYEVQLTNIKLVNSELKVVMPDNDTATLAVKEAEPGDANGDGEIDVDDASMIIYFMLGRITGVNPAWADINGDGDVDILDATLVIYRLLGRY